MWMYRTRRVCPSGAAERGGARVVSEGRPGSDVALGARGTGGVIRFAAAAGKKENGKWTKLSSRAVEGERTA